MKGINHKVKYVLGLVILTSVLFIALFGITTMSVGMSHDKNMIITNTSPCSYVANGSSICTMNLFDHISAWQNAIRALPNKNILSQILLSFAFIAFAFFNTKQIRRLYEKCTRTKIRLHEKLIPSHPIPLFVSLFARGILNTKSY